MNERAGGILLHPSSLPNRYPIGDLGPAATTFADFMAECGQRRWQMLPIGLTGGENSPYQSPSAFGGNPLLLSTERMVEHGFLGQKDIEFSIYGSEGKVDYPGAAGLKMRWLKRAFENFEKNSHGDQQSELDAFAHAESYWLEDFSLFLTIQRKVGTSDWTPWSQKLKTRQPDAILRAQKSSATNTFVLCSCAVSRQGAATLAPCLRGVIEGADKGGSSRLHSASSRNIFSRGFDQPK